MMRPDVGIELGRTHPARMIGETDYVRTFHSLADFAETADRCPPGTRAEENRPKWCGGTREDAVRMALRDGWQEALPIIDRIAAHVSRLSDAETVSDTFQYQYDVTGGSVDVARFLGGVPECMVETVPQKVAKRGKVARVIVPSQYHVGVKPETVIKRGAAVCALIDAMTRAHYSLEVWAVLSGARNGDRFSYAVKVHNAADTYRPEMIAYALGHPTMLRKLSFLVMDQERPKIAMMRGRGIPQESRLIDIPEELQDSPAIVLPILHGNDYPWDAGDEEIARWIETQAATLIESEARDDGDL